MSKVIENQIVQMQFDNKEFEKNVNASMKSLDNFKDKMDFSDSSKSFESLEKASRDVTFEKLNSAIDGVGDHFTLLGRITYKVVDKMADYFTNKLTSAINAVKKVSTDIIDVKAGYAKYDEYVTGVKSILYALGDDQKLDLVSRFGSEIEGVENYLSELMWYTDETSYNFTDMVNTIGKFMGAGISIESSVKDMEGLANWAALAGQNAATASQSMYQVSQALSRGYLQYMDWQQAFGTKNMGTTVAKDVLIDAAIKEGYIKDQDIKEAKKETGSDDRNVWRNYFFRADVMNKQMWLKTKVMETGLHEFSKSSDLMHQTIDHFTDEIDISATDLISALENMKGKNVGQAVTAQEAALHILGIDPNDKDAISKQADDIQYLSAQLAILSSKEYELSTSAMSAAQKAYTFTDAIQATKDAVGTKWTSIFTQLVGNAEEAAELWTGLSNKLWDIFAGPLDSMYNALVKWGEGTVTTIDEYGREMEISVRKHMWEGIGKIFSALGEAFAEIGSAIKDTIHYILTGKDSIEELTDEEKEAKTINFFEKVRIGIHKVADAISNFVHSDFFQSLMDFVRSFGKIIRPIVKGIQEIAKAILNGFGKGPSKSITNIIKGFTNVNEVIGSLIEKFIGSKGFRRALKIITKAIETLSGAIKSITDFFLDFTSGSMSLKDAIEKLGKAANKGLDSIKDFVYETTGIDLSWPISKLQSFIGWLTTDFTAGLEKAGEGIKILWKNLNEEVFAQTPEAWNKMLDNMENGTPGQKVQAVLEFLSTCIHNGIQALINTIEELTGADLTVFEDKLYGFFDLMKSMLEKFSPGIDAGWNAVKGIVKDIGKIFADVASMIFTVIGQVTGIENMGPDKILDLVFWILEKLAMIFVWIVENLGKAIQMAGPYLMACGDMIADGFGQIAKAFNYIIGVDKSPEALKALNNIKKALKVVLIILIAIEAYKLFKKISWFVESAARLSDLITGRIVKQTLLQQITNLIKAIASIMIAISILSNQDIGGIAMAVVALVIVVKVMLRALTDIMDAMVEFCAGINKSKIDEKQLSTVMSKVNSMISTLGKLATRIGIAMLIMSVADYIGGALFLERATIALSLSVLAICIGLKMIIQAIEKSKVDEKSLKQARKTLNAMVKALRKIAIDLGIMILILSAGFNSGNETAALYAMAFMITMTLALGLAGSMISRATSKIDTESMGNAAKIIEKLTISMLAIAGALWIMTELFNKMNINDMKRIGAFVGAITVIVGFIVGITLGLVLIGKIADKGSKAAEKSNTALDNFAKELGKSAGKMFKSYSSLLLIVAGVVASVLVVSAMTAMVKAFGVKILVGLGLTAALFVGMYFLIKLLGNLKIDKEAAGVQQFASVMGKFVLAILMLSSALMLLCLVALMPSFTEAVITMVIMTGVILGVCALAPYLASTSPQLAVVGTYMLSFAGAMVLLAGALALIANLEADQIIKGLLTILGFMGAIVLMAGVIGLIGGPLIAGLTALGAAFSSLGIGVAALLVAVLLLGFISDNIDDVTKKILDLANNVGPLMDAVVKLVIALIQGLADALANNAQALSKSIFDAIWAILKLVFALVGELFKRFVEGIFDFISKLPEEVMNVFASIWEFLQNFPAMLLEWFYQIPNGIIQALLAIPTFILWLIGEVINVFADLIAAVCDFLGIASPSKVFANIGLNLVKGLLNGILSLGQWLLEGVIGLFQSLIDAIVGILSFLGELGLNCVNWFWDSFKAAASYVWEYILALFDDLYDSIMNIFEPILNFGKEIINWFWEGIKIAFKIVKGLITGNFKEVWEGIKEALGFIGNAPKKILQLGKDLLDGLINGIKENIDKAVGKVKEFGGKVIGGLKKVLGINSPSKETFGMAINLVQGLVNGLVNSGGDAIGAVKGLGSALLDNFLPDGGLASVLNTDGITDTFKSASLGSFDFDTGLNDIYAGINVQPNVDQYAFNDQLSGMNHVYDMDLAFGGSASKFFEPQEATFNTTQLADITGSYEAGSDKTVDAIKELGEKIEAQAKAIEQMKIVLDTGVVAGEVAPLVDNFMGNKSRLNTRTGTA